MAVKDIPQEIAEFLNGKGGRSLLVKGSAGTGKTTMALEILNSLAKPEESFYLSTRVSDETLYQHFPWLKDKEMKGRIIDSSRVLLDALYDEEELNEPPVTEKKKLNVARDFLKSIQTEEVETPSKVDRSRLSVLLERIRMPEIERIYDSIDRILPNKSMVVMDSVEGVTHKYGLDAEELINTFQKDLVENSNTNLILVLEKAEAPDLEYLVDGVVSVTRVEIEGRRLRQIHLEKLRATEILQHSYPITLQNGRFRSLPPFQPDYSKIKPWKPIPDPENQYSTGINDLDGLLGGGFTRGSYNVLEIGENVSEEEYQSIMRLIFLNFILHDRGVAAVLVGGRHPENLRDDLTRFLPNGHFDSHVRVMNYFSSSSDNKYVMAMFGRKGDEARRIYAENIAAISKGDHGAILEYTGFDTLEYLRGDTLAIKELFSAVSQTKISHNLGIGIVKPGLNLTQEIMNMADTYFKIIDVNKCPVIYGVKPKTVMYAIVLDEEKGCPNVKLTPIV